MRIENKLFVVTGGGNGIGREVVLALLARGARVAALDLREEALAETTALAGTSAIYPGKQAGRSRDPATNAVDDM